MARRVFVLLCLLTAVRSQDSETKGINIKKENMILECNGGDFSDGQTTIKMDYGSTGLYTCKWQDCIDNGNCPTAQVKFRNAENLVQVDVGALVSVLVANVIMSVLIGWVFYSICAQPRPRGSYQGNKASDRINLIENPSRSGGDTYQRLNVRSEEYSALQPQRRQKNKQSV